MILEWVCHDIKNKIGPLRALTMLNLPNLTYTFLEAFWHDNKSGNCHRIWDIWCSVLQYCSTHKQSTNTRPKLGIHFRLCNSLKRLNAKIKAMPTYQFKIWSILELGMCSARPDTILSKRDNFWWNLYKSIRWLLSANKVTLSHNWRCRIRKVHIRFSNGILMLNLA